MIHQKIDAIANEHIAHEHIPSKDLHPLSFQFLVLIAITYHTFALLPPLLSPMHMFAVIFFQKVTVAGKNETGGYTGGSDEVTSTLPIDSADSVIKYEDALETEVELRTVVITPLSL
jgi:hypothetical protein